MDWAALNALLGVSSHWDAKYLKLVMNGRPVLDEHFCDPTNTLNGVVSRASLPKVEVFLGMGASLVANQVQEISADIRDAADALSDRLMGAAEANIYCSFKDVQAFGSHYDLHEVFAVQLEGTKTWNLYANQADAPIDPPPFTDDAQQALNAQRGPLMFQARMEPGDVLYIPRGWYHDAMASSDASLHLTFSVTPMTGRGLLRLLQTAALRDPVFRADLPDHRKDSGAGFQATLAAMADRLSDLARSDGFAIEVAAEQRRRRTPPFRLNLPARPRAAFYKATGREARLERDETGASLITEAGAANVGLMAEAAEWLLSRPAFSLGELTARYRHFTTGELETLVNALLTLKLCEPV